MRGRVAAVVVVVVVGTRDTGRRGAASTAGLARPSVAKVRGAVRVARARPGAAAGVVPPRAGVPRRVRVDARASSCDPRGGSRGGSAAIRPGGGARGGGAAPGSSGRSRPASAGSPSAPVAPPRARARRPARRLRLARYHVEERDDESHRGPARRHGLWALPKAATSFLASQSFVQENSSSSV